MSFDQPGGFMINNFVEKVLIQAGCENLAYTREILSRLPGAPVELFSSIRDILPEAPDLPAAFSRGKRTLVLMENKGRFLKSCPGTREHLCCLYMVLHHAAGCPLDCSYCILQAYLNNPSIVYHVNIEDMIKELREVFGKMRGRILRLGTGEYTDSLALERITQTMRLLAPLLEEFPDVFLEVKTKTADLASVMGLRPSEQIILAWSLNPKGWIESEEKGAAPLEERLRAARKAQAEGYPVAFHFDPLLRFGEWEGAYQEVVERLAETVDLSRVLWVSLGSFRFPPLLKTVIQERFPETELFHEEFIPGEDGKMRYFKPLRMEMYARMVGWLRKAAPDVFIYLCMEREDVWDAVFGFHPRDDQHLKNMLDARCRTL